MDEIRCPVKALPPRGRGQSPSGRCRGRCPALPPGAVLGGQGRVREEAGAGDALESSGGDDGQRCRAEQCSSSGHQPSRCWELSLPHCSQAWIPTTPGRKAEPWGRSKSGAPSSSSQTDKSEQSRVRRPPSKRAKSSGHQPGRTQSALRRPQLGALRVLAQVATTPSRLKSEALRSRDSVSLRLFLFRGRLGSSLAAFAEPRDPTTAPRGAVHGDAHRARNPPQL